MSAHTPGPWKASLVSKRMQPGIKGYVVSALDPQHGTVVISEAFPSPHLVAISEANANLIAAAPDLLAEHRRSLSAFEETDRELDRLGFKITSRLRTVARDGIRATKAAIAKAEGKS